MAWAVLAVIVVHSLLEYPLWYGPFQIAFGLCLGLLWPAAPRDGSPARCARARALRERCRCGVRGGAVRLRRLGLPAREPDLPAARSALTRDARRSLARHPPLLAVSQPGAIRRTDDHPADAGERGLDFRHSARALLHYSPEPRVIEKLIESATVLGREQEMLLAPGALSRRVPGGLCEVVEGAHRPRRAHRRISQRRNAPTCRPASPAGARR